MSDLWTSPSGEEEAAAWRRAMWGLLILAAVAALVGLMMVFLGRSHPGRGGTGLAGGAPTTSVSQPAVSTTTPASTATRSPTPTRSASTTERAQQTSTASPCPSPAACAVPGDDAGVRAALNGFRTSHGSAAVSGATTGGAQQCALSQGDGPACAPHYAWQPVPTRDGAKVILMIASRSDGPAWLLDPAMTSFSVGWAYLPAAAGGPGQYECAILKVG